MSNENSPEKKENRKEIITKGVELQNFRREEE